MPLQGEANVSSRKPSLLPKPFQTPLAHRRRGCSTGKRDDSDALCVSPVPAVVEDVACALAHDCTSSGQARLPLSKTGFTDCGASRIAEPPATARMCSSSCQKPSGISALPEVLCFLMNASARLLDSGDGF